MDKLKKAIQEMTAKFEGYGPQESERVKGFQKTIADICTHYGEFFNVEPVKIFKALEKSRDYTYANFYQWIKFPRLDDGKVMIFETTADLNDKIQFEKRFRCPNCYGISRSPYTCNSGKIVTGKTCDWKAHGLFKTMGRGLLLIVKSRWMEKPGVHECFMPIAFEGKETK